MKWSRRSILAYLSASIASLAASRGAIAQNVSNADGAQTTNAVPPAAATSAPDARPTKPVGRALLIGVNAVDAAGYEGLNVPNLGVCEWDVRDIAQILRENNFQIIEQLPTLDAKADAVIEKLETMATQCVRGDLFVLYFSGHGGLISDGRDTTVTDEICQTWCMRDRQLLDKEIYGALAKFAPEVRILVLSDSCHSGSVVKEISQMAGFLLNARISQSLGKLASIERNALKDILPLPRRNALKDFREKIYSSSISSGGQHGLWNSADLAAVINSVPELKVNGRGTTLSTPMTINDELDDELPLIKALKSDIVSQIIGAQFIKYGEILDRIFKWPDGRMRETLPEVQASVILISACQDNQVARVYRAQKNSEFTRVLKKIYKTDDGRKPGRYRYSYQRFQSDILMEFSDAAPNYLTMGGCTRSFEKQAPFFVG